MSKQIQDLLISKFLNQTEKQTLQTKHEKYADHYIDLEEVKVVILQNFRLVEHRMGQIDQTIYTLNGAYSFERVQKIFGSFETALEIYKIKRRFCLKCSGLILKPSWLCKKCFQQNSNLVDPYIEGVVR